MVEDFKKIKKENKQLKAKAKDKTKWNTKIISKSILRENRPTLTIQKPRDNSYVNRFFNEEWVND